LGSAFKVFRSSGTPEIGRDADEGVCLQVDKGTAVLELQDDNGEGEESVGAEVGKESVDNEVGREPVDNEVGKKCNPSQTPEEEGECEELGRTLIKTGW
jgi:hypothetical protein